jgi:glycosyltransferase involved in cell wall biosynthesis
LRRVLHLVPSPVARGAQRYARALADELDSPGHRHLVLCLFDGPDEVGVDEWLGASARGLPGAGFRPAAALALREKVRELRPEAVVAHGGDSMKYAATLRGVPVAYYAIGTLPEPARHGPRRALWRALAGRAAVVAAVSDDVADECTKVLGVPPGRLHVVPNGRDPDVFTPAEPGERHGSDAPVVAFVGRLTEGKRPEWFVDLVKALRGRGLDLRARLVGDGPLRDRLAAKALDAQVELVGPLDDVASFLRDVDVLVFPSLPDGEGMPGVLIEAAMCRVPTVSTRVPGASTVVEDARTGFVVGLDDFEGLVGAVADLLGDEPRRRRMGAEARTRAVELFSITASASRWESLIDSMAGRGPNPRV